jgi:hypothetical protein
MQNKISVADLIIGAGALVTFVFSFLSFFKLGDEGISAWDGDAGAFATTTPAILALVMLVWIVLELAGVSLPEQVITFNRDQLKATWAIGAFGIMLSWISADFGRADKGAGFWLMFLGSMAMAAGAVMALMGKGTETVDIPGASSDSSATDDPPTPTTEA